MAAPGRFYCNFKAADLRLFPPRKNSTIQCTAASCTRSEELFKHKRGLSLLCVSPSSLTIVLAQCFPLGEGRDSMWPYRTIALLYKVLSTHCTLAGDTDVLHLAKSPPGFRFRFRNKQQRDMQKVSSFPLLQVYVNRKTVTTKLGQTCKGIFELQLQTFCFVKKMYVELPPLVGCFLCSWFTTGSCTGQIFNPVNIFATHMTYILENGDFSYAIIP